MCWLETNRNKKDIMTKQNTFMLAVAGAALVAASQARAQSYAAQDILLNFRNPNAITGNNLEVNLGPVQNLASGVVAPAALVTGVFGPIGTGAGDVSVGFSAAAATASGTTGELWLTRQDTAADAGANQPPSDLYTAPGQSPFSTQNPIAVKIGDIGLGYNGGTPVAGYGNATTVVGATSGNSYQAQAEQNGGSGTATINYASESLSLSKGGNIESIQDGSANVYEALWDIPVTGTAPTYDGYFTFQTDGEVDFTSVTATPEPSSYVLLLTTGLGAWAMRRKIRSS
jgi:hypothetical protein